jgi:hypothetical protein
VLGLYRSAARAPGAPGRPCPWMRWPPRRGVHPGARVGEQCLGRLVKGGSRLGTRGPGCRARGGGLLMRREGV